MDARRVAHMSLNQWVGAIVALAVAFAASGGFWSYLSSRTSKSSHVEKLLLGLAYSALVARGEHYLGRGWITQDEYDDFDTYLFRPYKELGGNGAAERLSDQVRRLPFHAAIRVAVTSDQTRSLE